MSDTACPDCGKEYEYDGHANDHGCNDNRLDERRYVVAYTGQGDTEVVYGDQGIEDVLTYAAEQAVLASQQHILEGFVWGAHDDPEYQESLAQYPHINTTDKHREALVKDLLRTLQSQAYRPLAVGNVAIIHVDTAYTREAGESYVITIRKEDA